MYHFVAFSLGQRKTQLENGALVVSVDIDVGHRILGAEDNRKNNTGVHDNLTDYSIGKTEERALPLFIEFFNDLEIPVTFAVRGQLTEVNSPIIDLIKQSPVEHEIGSHGYYHREFTNLSASEVKNELELISSGMRKIGIVPKSFVFPKNKVAHLSLLEEFGYRCYRGHGNFRTDSMYIEKHNQLYNIRPSFYLGQSVSPVFLRKIVDISIQRKLPFHVWFHAWNFGDETATIRSSIARVFCPLFQYAKRKYEGDTLGFETMFSMVEKIEQSASFPARA